jgi:TP901 family phage tail tape measure protein
MARKITKSDIAEEDIFKGVRDSAEKTITILEKASKVLVEIANVTKTDIAKSNFGSSKGIDEFAKATEKAQKLQRDQIKIDQELQKSVALKAKAEQQLEVLAQKKLKTSQQQANADAKAAKEAEKLTKTIQNEANAYKQLESNTRALKNESKQLAAEMLKLELSGKKNGKEYRELSKTYKQVTTAAQEGDRQLKKIDNTVGDNFRNVGNYTGAVNKLKNGLGQLGLAFGIGTIVQGAGRTIVEFDQKIADLVSITGAGGDDLTYFKEQAIELGKGVEGGAGAVIEAYKLIGSAKPELLSNAEALDAVTQSAITLSQASGMTLPDAATALTDAMNQFGAPAEKAGQFIDALANGALLGSAEIPQVTEALLKFGAVAKTSNVSVEESVALIETLAEKGLKGAEAGTALRNVMLKISAPDALPIEAQKRLQALGISFEDLKDPSTSMADKLALLKPLLKDNAAMVKVFGMENTVSATNLIANTDRVKELTEGMGAQGTASKQAEDRTKTLSFAFNQLKESWNALILGLSSGEGTSAILVEGLSFLAQNLTTIVSLIGKVVLAWGTYLAIQKSIQAYNFIMTGGLKNVATGMMDLFKAGKQAGDGAELAGEGVSKAGKAMNAVPWIALIGVLVEMATAFYDIASGADAARRAKEMLANYEAAAEEKAGKRISDRQKDLDKTIAQLQRERNENKITETEFLKQKEESIKKTKDQISSDIKAVNARKKDYEDEIKMWQERSKGAASYIDKSGKIVSIESKIAEARAAVGGAETKLKIYGEELEGVNETQKNATSEVKVNTQAHIDNSGEINAKIPKIKELNLEYEKTNEYLTIQTDLLNQLAEIENERAIKQAETAIETQVSQDIANISNGGEVMAGEDSSYLLFEELILKKYALIEKFEADRLQLEINGIIERYRLMDAAEIQIAQERRDKLLAQEGITAEQKKAINDQYAEDLKLIEENNIQRNSDKLLEIEIAEAKSKDKIVEFEVNKNNEINSENDKIIDAQIEATQKKTDEITKIEGDGAKKNFETQKQFVKMAADYFVKRSNEKIAQYDKEIAAAETMYSNLQTMAANGNITAKESLAEQQKLIVEANRKKEQEQRRQERIKLAESVFASYTANVEKNEPNPLAKTITDITLLNQFISSLPTFYEGTDGTVSQALGMPQLSGRDGHVVRVDGSEKILNPKLSAMTGNLSTNEIAKIAMEYNNGKLINKGDGALQLSPGWSSSLIVQKLEDLTSIIENKPETNIQLGEIIQGTMNIIKTQKKGNSIVYNKFRVK